MDYDDKYNFVHYGIIHNIYVWMDDIWRVLHDWVDKPHA